MLMSLPNSVGIDPASANEDVFKASGRLKKIGTVTISCPDRYGNTGIAIWQYWETATQPGVSVFFLLLSLPLPASYQRPFGTPHGATGYGGIPGYAMPVVLNQRAWN